MTATWPAWWPLEISGAGLLGMLFCAADIWRLKRRQAQRDANRGGVGSVTTAPVADPLQLDLLTAVARMHQVRREGAGSIAAGRLLTCDLPRLQGHLTPETIAWMDEAEPGWRAAAEGPRA